MRAVLDTNVVVSALIFASGKLTWLREAWLAGILTPLVDRRCVEELVRVLSYPKFQLDREERTALLGDYLPYAEVVDTDAFDTSSVPRCADPDDQKFLDLAHASGADGLVTGDSDLLNMSGDVAFPIETPAVFRRRLPPP